MIAGVLAITLDRRLWPMAAGFAIAFLVVTRWPRALAWAISASNLVMTINAVWIWKPRDGYVRAQQR